MVIGTGGSNRRAGLVRFSNSSVNVYCRKLGIILERISDLRFGRLRRAKRLSSRSCATVVTRTR